MTDGRSPRGERGLKSDKPFAQVVRRRRFPRGERGERQRKSLRIPVAINSGVVMGRVHQADVGNHRWLDIGDFYC